MTAELMRALIRSNPDRRTCTAQQTRMGWILTYEQWTLRSARVAAPRWFQTLDAVGNMARELGLVVLVVELTGPEPPAAPSVPAKPRKRRVRKG